MLRLCLDGQKDDYATNFTEFVVHEVLGDEAFGWMIIDCDF